MSKKSVLERNKRRDILSRRYAQKRQVLKDQIKDPHLFIVEKIRLIQKLNSMPRDGSRVRYRKRCMITGRPRGYIGDFGISRIKLREITSLIPGVKKASW